ncbi:MAG: Glu/Leu/Phe/Val dehydrogenase dimerization domain-containing protein [Bacteroidia bacterium]|nr:leucine dehydrogenase [Bacteroidia bacterium]MDW8332587.1 Glu/Leu/Phe/Val dehydrogenase dimerization domain-containing protein [Bacteroidia bacterium]
MGEGIYPILDEGGHEQLVFCRDEATGLRALIAVHNTILGPALGGARFMAYERESDAVRDVLRLSRGMTFKAAAAGLNLGGGKAVIIGSPLKQKNEALLRRFGRFVEGLNGRYITAEDVGTTDRDMEFVGMETRHVVGLPAKSGDPSPFTAYGVFVAIKAALKYLMGSESLSEKKVAVAGVGKVGAALVDLLVEAGAKITIADVSIAAAQAVAAKHPSVVVADPGRIHAAEVDVFAPCALGAVLNPQTIPELKCALVVGAANNQLADENRDASALQERGVLYVPDFVANAGGLINVALEYDGAYSRERALAHVEKIYSHCLDILKSARESGQTPHQSALVFALNRIESIGNVRRRR